MAKSVLEVRCLLISPGDVSEERAAIVDLIGQWNAQIGTMLRVRLELVTWEDHSSPDVSASAQTVLDRQIVDDCEIGLALFWTRLGTPTLGDPSGSVHEIARLRSKRARVLVYFCDRAVPPSVIDIEQLSRLKEYRARLEGLHGTYIEVSELREKVLLHLTSYVIELSRINQEIPAVPPRSVPAELAVSVSAAGLLDIPRGPRLSITVQNRSRFIVYLSGLSLEVRRNLFFPLLSGVGVDVLRKYRELLPGSTFSWSLPVSALLSEHDVHEYTAVVVHDDLGYAYRSQDGALSKAISEMDA